MIKLLLGGSPCTHWSITQTKNRETEPSGQGWELFLNYKIARDKYQPDYFLYENNKSMSKEIRAQITKELGVEPVLINSALVSAQNRQRLYWVGKREPDGFYSQVDIEQPEDRGILLRDILETGAAWREKGYALQAAATSATAEDMIARRQRNGAAEPVIKPLSEKEMDYMVRETKDGRNHFDYGFHHDATQDKSSCVTANTSKGVPYNVLCEPVNVTRDGKSQCLRATYYKDGIRNLVANDVDRRTCVAEPVRVGDMPNAKGEIRGSQSKRIYAVDGKSSTLQAGERCGGCSNLSSPRTGLYAVPVEDGPVRIGTIENDVKNADYDSQQYRVYSPDAKSVTLCGQGGGVGAKTGLYATPCPPHASQRGYEKRIRRDSAGILRGHDDAGKQDEEGTRYGG